MAEKKGVMHFSEMLKVIARAYEYRQTLNIKAYKSDGHIILYKGWLIHHDYWRGGYIRIRNPKNREIRMIPEIFILEVNNKKIYL